MNQPNPTRRRFLQGATTVAAALLVPQYADAVPSRPGATSANGWPIAALKESRIEGSNLTMLALPGPVTVLLTHLVRRYLYEIDHTVAQHELLGGNAAVQRGGAIHASTYRSGTALAIRPAWYPVGVAGGYCARDTMVLRDILADFNGVLRWGGDMRPAYEAHFQIDVPPSNPTLQLTAAQIATWNQTPGRGAGVLVDPATPTRRNRALALTSQQQPRQGP